MSCILRISTLPADVRVPQVSLKPYRIEDGTAHFEVSGAEVDDLSKQVEDAITFLQRHAEDIRMMMNAASGGGVLDFAIERRDAAVQFDRFPAALVVEAGRLGLGLELSQFT